jgi:hypothetical protein
MAAWMVAALGLASAAARGADEGVLLREQAGDGASRVLIEMKAEGELRFEAEPKGAAAKVKPQPLKVESRLDYFETPLRRDPDGAPRKVARRVVEAVAALGNAGGLVKIRPEMALLMASRRDSGPIVWSPSGPLTRQELDLVQVPGEPLALVGLLSEKPVKVGDRWSVSDEAARNLSDYDVVAKNGLEAKLESIDEAAAKIQIGGQVRGSARGGEGTMAFTGRLTFDRKRNRIARLEVSRDETRKPGPVESGLAARSTLLVEREPAETPAPLAEDALATLPQDDDPARERLLLNPPEGRYTLEHDRDWHLKREDSRQVVLTRLEKGEPIAHLHLSVGPNAGAGRHQEVSGFAADVKKALGPRFDQVVGAGEVDAGPEAGYQYKMAVLGHEGERPVLWFYYLLAGPDGDQLLAIFTLDAEGEAKFGGADRAILSTLRWKAPGAAK